MSKRPRKRSPQPPALPRQTWKARAMLTISQPDRNTVEITIEIPAGHALALAEKIAAILSGATPKKHHA